MSEIRLEMASLDRKVYSGTIHHITVPSYQGDMEVYRGHRAIIALLKPGQVKLSFTNHAPIFYYVSGGVLEVHKDTITLLADTIIHAKDMNEATLVTDKRRLEQLISNRQADQGYGKMLTKMAQTRAKLRVARSHNRISNKNKIGKSGSGGGRAG